jgi:4-oxalomesaconate tautomerase
MSQRSIPCLFMRGGTSRGPFFNINDLPTDLEIRNKVLLAAMGSPDTRQIDGLGGADMLTSKIAIISDSKRKGIDVDYLFAQAWLDKAIIDTTPSCGNMLAAVGPFAIERGLVRTKGDETCVNIYNVNTGSRIEAVIQTPNGQVIYEGKQHIDGVPGTAAPILLNFTNITGSKCNALFPTGSINEDIQGVRVSCIDVAMPMVIMRANDLGVTGYETNSIANDSVLMQRIEKIRLEAGRRMGLGDVTEMVVPKVGILAKPRQGGTIYSCYLTPHHVHAAHAVTGAICVACCVSIKETVADTIAKQTYSTPKTVRIEHPSGIIDIDLSISGRGTDIQVLSAGVVRTARKIMDGQVFVPARLWP